MILYVHSNTDNEITGQLSFNKDDVIVLINTHESGWWTGEIRSQRGYFPSTFIDASALEN